MSASEIACQSSTICEVTLFPELIFYCSTLAIKSMITRKLQPIVKQEMIVSVDSTTEAQK